MAGMVYSPGFSTMKLYVCVTAYEARPLTIRVLRLVLRPTQFNPGTSGIRPGSGMAFPSYEIENSAGMPA